MVDPSVAGYVMVWSVSVNRIWKFSPSGASKAVAVDARDYAIPAAIGRLGWIPNLWGVWPSFVRRWQC
jgi:hypothetical protein